MRQHSHEDYVTFHRLSRQDFTNHENSIRTYILHKNKMYPTKILVLVRNSCGYDHHVMYNIDI